MFINYFRNQYKACEHIQMADNGLSPEVMTESCNLLISVIIYTHIYERYQWLINKWCGGKHQKNLVILESFSLFDAHKNSMPIITDKNIRYKCNRPDSLRI